MSIDKFKRVIWRLREMKTNSLGIYTNKQIRRAIMEEIGTDERTIEMTIKKLIEMEMLSKEELGNMKIKEGIE
ncbi:hypothetical protein CMI41_04795 [Candidatus Pacearchaeota archaeon]|nr:hypothetical protein [Candidatus Pacearchaeota archaeon]|tara:strand:+ start:559 stop:777 length:219 start_codon:yes stop_codon:yes gene_type:complete